MGLKTRALTLLAGWVMFLLVGCVTTESPVDPSSSNTGVSLEEHSRVLLRPGIMFSLQVEVGGVQELDQESLRIRQNGSAVLPMLGSVELEGLTLPEASEKLSGLYSVFYKEKPLILLQFMMSENGSSSPWGYVTVLGRVKNPGRVNLPPTRDLTVSGAIQGADGFDTSANLRAVRISRDGASGEKTHRTVDLNRIGETGEIDEDLKLKAGDIIYVPERRF